MKKLILGCTLILGGIIGASAWLIACICMVQQGAWSSVLNAFNGIEGVVIILFYVIAILGAVLAVKSLKVSK